MESLHTFQSYRAGIAAEASRAGRVLVADDQPHVLDALQLLLKSHDYRTEAVTHPARVLQALQTGEFDVVLMDLNYTRDTTAGGEGLELVSQIRMIDENLPLVVMTAWSSVDLAVEAMRRGASDFVQKPWGNQQLVGKAGEAGGALPVPSAGSSVNAQTNCAMHVRSRTISYRRTSLR